MNPGMRITGVVRLEGGKLEELQPPANVATAQNSVALAVAATNAGVMVAGLRLAVALNGVSPSPLGTALSSGLKEDGTFAIENVGAGKYQLNVVALPAGTYVKSAKLGSVDLMRNEIDLTGGGGGNIEIVLARNPADVNGGVTSERNESTSGLTVTLWTADAEPGSINDGVRTATTDQNGNFQFQGLRPGTYYVAAWEEIDTGLAQARDFVAQMQSDATKVEIKEGRTRGCASENRADGEDQGSGRKAALKALFQMLQARVENFFDTMQLGSPDVAHVVKAAIDVIKAGGPLR